MIILCGRYTVFTEAEIIEMNAIINEISRKFGDGAVNTGEIFPTNTTPVLIMEDNRLAPTPVSWGFPKRDGKGAVINARSETALQKAMFSKPLLTRRCVIPSTGFYEWRHVEGKKKKDKYLFRLPDTQMLYMAGMTGFFKDMAGKPIEMFCILTTSANESVRKLHDRMPVILAPDEREAWLADDEFMQNVLDRAGPELLFKMVG